MHFHVQFLGGVVWCGHIFVGRHTAVAAIVKGHYERYIEKQTVPNLFSIGGGSISRKAETAVSVSWKPLTSGLLKKMQEEMQ